MGTTYEKIRTTDGKVSILRNPTEREAFGIPSLVGIRVNREGEYVFEGKVGDMDESGPYREICIFALDEIKWRKPMVMSLHYGELVYMDGKP